MFHSLAVLLLAAALVKSSDFRSEISGKGFDVIFPGAPLYQNVSQAYNLRFEFKPAVVAYPSSPQQVSDIVNTGAKYQYRVVARSGGHSYIANGLGGKDGVVVIDMSRFTHISVDSATAVIESGNRLGDIALALSTKNRGMPHGVCPYVGIGGHSAFGGYGFMSRMWGLTLDNVLEINLVLANGTITTASNSQNQDLFWALRGAGSSFGITTSIKVKTYPAPPSATVIQISWDLNIDQASDGLNSWQKFVLSDIPSQFGGEIVLAKGSTKGNVSFALRAAYYGPLDQVNSTIAPFLNTLPMSTDIKFTTGSYIDIVTYLGGAGTLNTTLPDVHDTFYAKSIMTPRDSPMTVASQKAFISYLANEGFSSRTSWFVEVELYGGSNSAINAIPLDSAAWAHRSSIFTFQLYASSGNRLPPYPSEGFQFVEGMADSIVNNNPKNWGYGAYPNYVDDKLEDWKQRYYNTHYARLHKLKKVYDPRGTFSFPTSIED
ncbi:glucooligosaccharide oxidase [Crucibulum laeve]|uniref:Glucooligosaccharide oxidase n=1 Tax=Crucibulum laeve TaxID=68775 RepID=A0A5C3LXE8_9AGAR|nr:glucooligosaccharide oxidase [Crucibulum laeve]